MGSRKTAYGLMLFLFSISHSLTFMAIPAKTYDTNWAYIFANAAIILVAPLVVFCYLPFFRRLDVTSAYEYLEKRFNLALRLYGSAAFILIQTGRMAIVLYLFIAETISMDTLWQDLPLTTARTTAARRALDLKGYEAFAR
ncbi:MAG: hypothetical protein ACREEM_10860 [Blastocatellia bacterium]